MSGLARRGCSGSSRSGTAALRRLLRFRRGFRRFAVLRRRFGLLGQTLDGQRVWDVRRGLACLRTVADLKDVPLWLQGKDDMAGIALYAGVFEPDVVRLDLWHPSPSHQEGPYFLNVRRVLDMPQAVALALPRKVRIYVKDDAEAKAWEWPRELQKALEQDSLQIRKVPEGR